MGQYCAIPVGRFETIANRRTGSSHVLNDILWRRFFKQRTEGPAWLTEFLDERDHLMRFRAQSGLSNAPSLAASQRVVDWTRDHDLDMDRVAEVKRLIDYDKPGLKERSKPKPSVVRALSVFSVLFLAAAILVGTMGAIVPSAIQVVQSETWYAVRLDRAKRMFHPEPGRAVVFKKGQCSDQAAISAQTAYPVHDVAVLCDLMASDDGAEVIESARIGQWVLAAAATLGLLWLGGILRLEHRRDSAALAMHAHLERTTARPAPPARGSKSDVQHPPVERIEPKPILSNPSVTPASAGDLQSPPAPQPVQEGAGPKALSEIQFLWDHWKFHADQRIKAFNFFVVLSVFANGGLFTAVEKGAHIVVLAVIGTFITLLATVFWMIDSRSRALLRLSEPGIKRFEEGLWPQSRVFQQDQASAHTLARYSHSFRVLFAAQMVLGLLVVAYASARGLGLDLSWLPDLAHGKPQNG